MMLLGIGIWLLIGLIAVCGMHLHTYLSGEDVIIKVGEIFLYVTMILCGPITLIIAACIELESRIKKHEAKVVIRIKRKRKK